MTARTASDCVAEAKALVERLAVYGHTGRGQDHPQNRACADAARTIRALLAVIEAQREALRQIAAWDWHEIEPNGADIPENVEPWARELDDACTQMQRIARAALASEPSA